MTVVTMSNNDKINYVDCRQYYCFANIFFYISTKMSYCETRQREIGTQNYKHVFKSKFLSFFLKFLVSRYISKK